MLQLYKKLIHAGISLIPVRPKGKAPIKEEWSALPTYTFDEFFDVWSKGQNVGIRPGAHSKLVNGDFLITIDVDVSSEDVEGETYRQLKKAIPDYKNFVEIRSGNKLGLSRHFIGTTDKPLRSKRIWRHPQKITMPDGQKRDKAQIEIYGTGKQHVAPGSIHPDGFPYEVVQPTDLDAVLSEIEGGGRSSAFIPSADLDRAAGGTLKANGKRTFDDLEEIVHTGPVDLTDDEIMEVLENLSDDRLEDYQPWLEVGFALNKQFPDEPEFALELWKWFSKESDKYDEDVIDDKWETIKDDKGGNSITFRTLIKEANERRRDKAVNEVLETTEDGDEEKPDTSWRKQLHVDADGQIKSVPTNLKLIIENDHRLKDRIKFNIFRNNTVLCATLPKLTPAMIKMLCKDKVNGVKWNDTHDRNMRMFFESRRKDKGWGLKVSDRDLLAAIDIAAQENTYHPVRDYLDSLRWDGKPRAEYLYIDYLGLPDTPYSREVAYLTLVGAVARIYRPGCKFDFVPIIEGIQGKRKSTFVKVLSKGWFGGLHPNFHDDKSMVESMLGKWILELPELAGFGRADVKTIKQFITTDTDNARLSYDRRAQEFPRQCIFIGTTNDDKYLADETGNRRYWPVPATVEEIDTDKLADEVDQIWAEAVCLHDALREKHPFGDLPLYVQNRDAIDQANRMQKSREIDHASDGWAEIIKMWIDKSGTDKFEMLDGGPGHSINEVTLMDVWTGAFGKNPDTYTGVVPKQLGAAMRKLGDWEDVGVRRLNGRAAKFWRRKGFYDDLVK